MKTLNITTISNPKDESYKIKTGFYPKEILKNYSRELSFSKQQIHLSSSQERMNTKNQHLKPDGALVEVVYVT